MQEMAAAYAGPHRVVLNRNDRNLGLIGHLNRVMALASGGFVVQNAGDDVSAPDRVAKLVAAWRPPTRACAPCIRRCAGSTPTALATPWTPARPPMAGVTAAEVVADSRPGQGRHLVGASIGWDRRLWDDFGPLPAAALIEDRPIAFRAALSGGIAWIDEPLLDYRAGGASDGGGDAARGFYLKKQRWYRSFQRAYLADLDRRPGADAPDAAALGRAAAAEPRAARLRDRPRRGRLRRPARPPARGAAPGPRPPRPGAAARPAQVPAARGGLRRRPRRTPSHACDRSYRLIQKEKFYGVSAILGIVNEKERRIIPAIHPVASPARCGSPAGSRRSLAHPDRT